MNAYKMTYSCIPHSKLPPGRACQHVSIVLSDSTLEDSIVLPRFPDVLWGIDNFVSSTGYFNNFVVGPREADVIQHVQRVRLCWFRGMKVANIKPQSVLFVLPVGKGCSQTGLHPQGWRNFWWTKSSTWLKGLQPTFFRSGKILFERFRCKLKVILRLDPFSVRKDISADSSTSSRGSSPTFLWERSCDKFKDSSMIYPESRTIQCAEGYSADSSTSAESSSFVVYCAKNGSLFNLEALSARSAQPMPPTKYISPLFRVENAF